MGDASGAEALLALVARSAEVADPIAALAEAARSDVTTLTDEVQVCSCHGVSKGEILEAIRERGLRAPSEVQAVTRAGTGCGSCKSLVAKLVEAETGEATTEAAYLCPCRMLTREQVADIRHWLEVFVGRFFGFSQFKRSAMPNGPKVVAGGSLSPRGDWRAPSDLSAAIWLDELRRRVPPS